MTEWKEFKIHVPEEYAQLTVAILLELGSSGTAERDSHSYPPLPTDEQDTIWDLKTDDFPLAGVIVTGYFDRSMDKEKIERSLKAEAIPYATIQSALIAEDDWVNEWEKYYHTIPVSDQFLIVPIWEKETNNSTDRSLLYMDPGLAFGTGNHPTTQLSILALEKVISGGEAVFDVGTGSGILTIVAASLGAKWITAYDVDPQAVRSAKRNIALNDLSSDIRVLENDLLNGVRGQADIIVANILAPLIEKLTPQVEPLLKLGGVYIVSGILKQQADRIINAIQIEGLQVTDVSEMGDWVAITAKKVLIDR